MQKRQNNATVKTENGEIINYLHGAKPFMKSRKLCWH